MIKPLAILKTLATVTMLLCSLIGFANQEKYYIYKTYPINEDPKFIDIVIIDSIDKKILYGHSGSLFESCNEKHMICLFDISLNFAINKLNTRESHWFHSGYKHSIENEISIESLGKKVLVKVIKVLDKEGRVDCYVLYSPKYGVMGFTIYYADPDSTGLLPRTYISTSKYGYGSNR